MAGQAQGFLLWGCLGVTWSALFTDTKSYTPNNVPLRNHEGACNTLPSWYHSQFSESPKHSIKRSPKPLGEQLCPLHLAQCQQPPSCLLFRCIGPSPRFQSMDAPWPTEVNSFVVLHPILWPNNTPLYGYTTVYGATMPRKDSDRDNLSCHCRYFFTELQKPSI